MTLLKEFGDHRYEVEDTSHNRKVYNEQLEKLIVNKKREIARLTKGMGFPIHGHEGASLRDLNEWDADRRNGIRRAQENIAFYESRKK